LKYCKRGHPRIPANTRTYTRSNSDRQYTMCRACASFLQRMRYRNDDAYRVAEQVRNRAKYCVRRSVAKTDQKRMEDTI